MVSLLLLCLSLNTFGTLNDDDDIKREIKNLFMRTNMLLTDIASVLSM